MRGGGRKGTVGSSSDPQMPLGVDRLFLRGVEVPRVCKLHPDQVIAILSATEVSSSVPVLPLGPQDGILGVVLQALWGQAWPPWGGAESRLVHLKSVFPSYSASVRLPASTVKLGEKLERYHTAIQVGAEDSSGARARVEGAICEHYSYGSASLISDLQRSESVRAPGSSRTEVLVTPAGVASKRHLFEKELAGQNRTEPTIRKVRARSQLLGL